LIDSYRADPLNRQRTRNRCEAVQIDFGFVLSRKVGGRFRQLEFPWLHRWPPRTKRKNFAEFKRFAAALRGAGTQLME